MIRYGSQSLAHQQKSDHNVTNEKVNGKTSKDQLGNIVEKMSGPTPPPVVILVGTQLGENIGAAARAMLNFGLSEMRLVAPRDGWPNEDATAMAAGAAPVLETIQVYDTTAEAVADLRYVMAATARRRELEIPVCSTQDAGVVFRGWQAQGHRSGILFGPEKAGLTNDDVVLADKIVTYPINPAFQSLNLAQAVGVFAYIWASSEGTELPEIFTQDENPPAKRDDLIRMFEHFEDELQASGFFYPPQKKALMVRNIRAPFIRAKMTEQEVRTMRGMIKTLAKGRGRHLGAKD
jgi:tRNA/rRNA methyltransferase